VPEYSRVAAADRSAVLDNVRHDENFRIAGPAAVGPVVHPDLAETRAERNVLFRGQLLIRKTDDLVLVEQLDDVPEGARVHLPGQINPRDFRAQRRARTADGQHGGWLPL
jgi:hypothetical protein